MSTPSTKHDLAHGILQQERLLLEKVYAQEVDGRYQWYVTNTQTEQSTNVIITSRPIRNIASVRILPFVAYFGEITAPEYLGVFVHEWSGQCHTMPGGERYHFKLESESFIPTTLGTLSMTGRYAASNEFVFTNRIREITTLTVSLTDFRAPFTFTIAEYEVTIAWGAVPAPGTGAGAATITGLPTGLQVGSGVTPLYSPNLDIGGDVTAESPAEDHRSYQLAQLLLGGFTVTFDGGGGIYDVSYNTTLPAWVIDGDLTLRVTASNAPAFVIPLEVTYLD
jgi:hypothetical protein